MASKNHLMPKIKAQYTEPVNKAGNLFSATMGLPRALEILLRL